MSGVWKISNFSFFILRSISKQLVINCDLIILEIELDL